MIGKQSNPGYIAAAAVFRVALGLVFVAAELLKWFDPGGQGTYYGNLAHAAPAVGWVIIAGELLLGVWLISGVSARPAAAVALFTLALFSGAIVADMLANHPIPCGCFGAAWAAAHSPAAIEHGLALGIARDILFLAAAAALLLLPRESPAATDAPGAQPQAVADPRNVTR